MPEEKSLEKLVAVDMANGMTYIGKLVIEGGLRHLEDTAVVKTRCHYDSAKAMAAKASGATYTIPDVLKEYREAYATVREAGVTLKTVPLKEDRAVQIWYL